MATIYTQRTYTQSDRAKEAWKALEDQLAAKPEAYDSRWLSQLDAALGQILNRESFSYDAASDQLYRQYQQSTVRQGQMAMMDTLGQAAGLTGGYGNSYAQMAAQQAYQEQLQGLNDVLPQLYNLALETYDRQNQNLLNQYGVLADREALDYGRYTDSMNAWADQRDYLTDRADSQQALDYTQFRDLVEDDQWLAQFQEDIRRYDYEHKLGEFASLGLASGGSSGSGSSGRGGKKVGQAIDRQKDEDEEVDGDEKYLKSTPHYVTGDRFRPYLYTYESY